MTAGAGTVLLVDDEEQVRMSTAAMLSDLGYEVVEADGAERAMDMVRDGLQPDLVVTDHLMPGMNGTDLARRLRTQEPHLPVLIVSGYADVEGIAPDLPRLTKPFRVKSSVPVWRRSGAPWRPAGPRRTGRLVASAQGRDACGRGEIGRRAGLKIRFRKECRFEPDRPHHSKTNHLD